MITAEDARNITISSVKFDEELILLNNKITKASMEGYSAIIIEVSPLMSKHLENLGYIVTKNETGKILRIEW